MAQAFRQAHPWVVVARVLVPVMVARVEASGPEMAMAEATDTGLASVSVEVGIIGNNSTLKYR